MTKVTLVTGLWDIGRGNLKEFKRSFDHYVERLEELLSLDLSFVVFVPEELERKVHILRGHGKKTTVIVKNTEQFKTWFPFWDKVQEIRTSEQWLDNQPSWLLESPQAQLEYYNPIVMSKMFMLNDATILDGGQSDYYFWIDGGLTTTCGLGFLENLRNIGDWMESNHSGKFLFLNYPYDTDTQEIHGFKRKGLEQHTKKTVESIPRGGFFGGHKDIVKKMNGWYYDTLNKTLAEGLMGTEESIFCILDAVYKPHIHNFMLEGNGLVYPFFESLKKVEQQGPVVSKQPKQHKTFSSLKTAIYILTYNSPKQVKWLLNSFEVADANFLTKPDIYLIDNSTNPDVEPEYQKLCNEYKLNRIKQNNIGICGARQLAAEHFDQHNYDYYLFFEDDMFLYPPAKAKCYAGFDVYTDNLFERSLEIMHLEKFDYLKLSYSEFYGSNQRQWAWYNISQIWREEYFPDNNKLPEEGLAPNVPLTTEYAFKTYGSLGYYEGEYHYCNWPLWFSREGNRKIFLEERGEFLFEQKWMADTFYKIKEGKIRCAVLALSPINHNRFDFYPASERKEC